MRFLFSIILTVLAYLLPRLLVNHGSISVAPRFSHGAAPD